MPDFSPNPFSPIVERLPRQPAISQQTPGWSDEAVGDNMNGPSLLRVPGFLEERMGRYYLYFAHHGGRSIRLAFAEDLEGPWIIYTPGTLQLAQTGCSHHIASPDVHVDHAAGELVMYYHGCCAHDRDIPWSQWTCVARSSNGLHWTDDDRPLGPSYLRAFEWRGQRYGIAMPGVFYRMTDGWSGLEPRPGRIAGALCGVDDSEIGPHLKPRHFAVQVVGDTLILIFSRAGDRPERLLLSTVALTDDWLAWTPTPPVELLRPERTWEGADLPIEASRNGKAEGPVHQLRDPALFTDSDGQTYLAYAAAGESAIALARLKWS